MKRRDVVTVLVVIVFLILGFRYLNQDNTPKLDAPVTTPATSLTQKELLNRFGKNISDNAIKVELRPVGEVLGTAIATKEAARDGVAVSVLADLPELEVGSEYKVIAGEGEASLALGVLSPHKGGWLLDSAASTSIEEIKKITIMQEDETTVTTIFEGEFSE